MLSKSELKYVEDTYFFEKHNTKKYVNQIRWQIRRKGKLAVLQLSDIVNTDIVLREFGMKKRLFPSEDFTDLVLKLIDGGYTFDVNALWQKLMVKYPNLRQLTIERSVEEIVR